MIPVLLPALVSADRNEATKLAEAWEPGEMRAELIRQVILLDSIGLVTGAEQDTATQLRKAVLSRQKRLDKRKPQYPDLHAAAAARQAQSDFDFASALLLAEPQGQGDAAE